MGDSDDDYDRKRRDKFRGERAEASYRSSDRSSRQPREEWVERESWSRPRAREYRPRDRYSPGMEQATKRMRHDYYGEQPYFNHYTPYHSQAPHRNFLFREPAAVPQQVDGQQPPMMSFKAFLATQDDNISDSEAIEKYNDYKLEFQRQQLNEFFVAHKDDEWFRLKYHPEDSVKRKAEQTASLKKRLEVFIDLLNSGKMDGTTVDCARTTDLLKLLDTVVVKLEGGTDEDLAALEQEYEEMEQKYRELKEKEVANEKAKEAKSADTNTKMEEGEIEDIKIKTEKMDDTEPKKVENKLNPSEEGQIEDEAIEEPKSTSQNGVEEPNKGTETNGNDNQEPSKKPEDEDVTKPQAETDDNVKSTTEPEQNPEKTKTKSDEKEKVEKKRKRSYSDSSSSSSSSSDSEDEDKERDKGEKNEEKKDKDKNEETSGGGGGDQPERREEGSIVIPDEVKPEKPKALHKTTSIFLRNLAPTITRQEVEAVCARYEGFLRVALADPQPERRWLRRGWVTFKRDANIKEICWNLNNIRLRECELGAIVNRDLSRRIRPVNGITAHKQVVRSDIRIAAKVTLHLDERSGLWVASDGKEDKPTQSFGLVSNNPVLNNITDYLIEEASAEEEELLGIESSTESPDSITTIERDETLIKVLDKILLYLRIVHSVDYYNHCEYPNEDEMPNRCGILHARGPPPTSKTDMTQFIGSHVETKMANFLPEKPKVEKDKNEAKLISLALKDVDTEVDKFVQANTRELAKDKWLCPLSGKKFKGPDFVRKHIFNKHAEKIEEVKKEVEFFNNYLKDAKRPMLPEAVQPKREETPAYPSSFGGYGGGYNRPQPFYNHQGFQPRTRGFAPRGRGGPADFGRPIIHYRDLDAPREPDEFI